jgi:hypothetical protein
LVCPAAAGLKIKNYLNGKSAGAPARRANHFLIGGARSKKFEQNLQKNNARAGEIPPLPPFLPAREKANFSD